MAPAQLPMPTTDPTALRGNMSPVSVNRLADQPWCAPAAKPINNTAVHTLDEKYARITSGIVAAKRNIANLRARLTDQPRLIKDEEIQPPPTEPMSAMMYTTIR